MGFRSGDAIAHLTFKTPILWQPENLKGTHSSEPMPSPGTWTYMATLHVTQAKADLLKRCSARLTTGLRGETGIPYEQAAKLLKSLRRCLTDAEVCEGRQQYHAEMIQVEVKTGENIIGLRHLVSRLEGLHLSRHHEEELTGYTYGPGKHVRLHLTPANRQDPQTANCGTRLIHAAARMSGIVTAASESPPSARIACFDAATLKRVSLSGVRGH